MKPGKQRLDQILVDRGLAETRTKAQAIIMSGQVFSGERKLDKPGESLRNDVPLEIRQSGPGWVSRGALKLIEGLDRFGIDPTGLTCLDVGASTGGFTEVLLSRGAARVYAVDVGYGQLAQKLRDHPRVVNLERTNARHLTASQVPERIDLLVCDASFIGLSTVLPAPLSLCGSKAFAVVLIKPQFEVGPERVGKGGVVRDPLLHEEVCAHYQGWFLAQGWQVMGIVRSPITGPAGNVEFLLGARRTPEQVALDPEHELGNAISEPSAKTP
jgi:23S rRNA (cytidine1920-2'-O)/16S rRNA (cytidine1409-2'-O)-methyltransferase